MLRRTLCSTAFLLLTLAPASAASAQPVQLDEWKSQLSESIEGRRKFTANIVDQIFSFGELGFQEFETSRYLVALLRDNGFTAVEARVFLDSISSDCVSGVRGRGTYRIACVPRFRR